MNIPPPSGDVIRDLADRKTGIGFDQLLWLEKPRLTGAAVYYRIFNPDGSEAEQCGNGARCIARLIGGSPGQALVLQHRGGSSRARLELNGMVSVEIAVPEFDPKKVPFIADHEEPFYRLMLGRCEKSNCTSFRSAIRTASFAWTTWTPRASPRSGPSSRTTSDFQTVLTSVLWRRSTRSTCGCAFTSAETVRPGPVAPGPARRLLLAGAQAGSLTE